MLRRALFVLTLAVMPSGGRAQSPAPIIVSPAAESIAVTLYRDPRRHPERAIDFDPDREDPLGGYAMITETRTVDLPPGEAIVRFEGVASGIVPQSAILFEADIKEKNFDSRLLSKRGLIDAFTGQRVMLRRTDPKTGRAIEEPGTIRSNPDRLILQTRDGFEAVDCEGNLTGLIFPQAPVDLTAKPTLSMRTHADHSRSQGGGRVTLTLAYLAGNFDWQANYVGTFADDGQSLRLFGWMTLASRDRTSFVDARAGAMAGVVARAEKTYEEEEAEAKARKQDPYSEDNIEVSAQCWPSGRTSDMGGRGQLFTPGALPTIAAPIFVRFDGYGGGGGDGEIIVTGSRVKRVEVGDLKLYTIDRPTTVAAASMKQVRFLKERTVKGQTLFVGRYRRDYLDDVELLFRFENRKATGGGEPLPAGQVSLFQNGRFGRQLVGETFIADKAVDEEVAFKLPDAEDYGVDIDTDDGESGDDWQQVTLTVTNDNGHAIRSEIEFDPDDDYRFERFSQSVQRRKGKTLWQTTVPAKSKRSIMFRRIELPDPNDGS